MPIVGKHGTTTLDGMAWLRVFSAAQVLMAPTRAYRVTHKRAREVIEAELGYCPKGKPGTPVEKPNRKGWRSGGEDAIEEWLGISYVMHTRAQHGCVVPGDKTYIIHERKS